MEPRIGVIGCNGEIPEKIRSISERIGGDIAKNNSLLICGGLGGVMEAACRGAKRAGGVTVGIVPSLNPEEANPYVDIPITTGFGKARNALVVSCSDVIIAIDGRAGTLSEMGLALSYGKPVVIVKDTGGMVNSIGKELGQRVYSADVENAVKVALGLVRI
jgi:uncharacterized protein (TIGR00725 family)